MKDDIYRRGLQPGADFPSAPLCRAAGASACATLSARVFDQRNLLLRAPAIAIVLVAAQSLNAQDRLDFPMSLAASPDGKYVLALSAGDKASISVMAVESNGAPKLKEISRVPLPDAWLGLTFAQGGKFVYAGGGSRGSVYEFSFANGELKQTREMKASDFAGDVAVSPDGRLIYAANVFKNLIAVINPQSGRVIEQFKTGRRPYRILFHPDGKSYFVSSWADATVYQYNTANGEEIGRIRLGAHPTDMVLSAYKPPLEEGQEPVWWKYRLFVAAANTNSVFAVGIGDNKTMRLVDAFSVAPAPLSPLGMTPSALALAPDQKKLYIACSDADAVAMADVSDVRASVEGFAEAEAYPAALRVLPSGQLIAANAKAGTVSAVDLDSEKDLGQETELSAAKPTAARVVYVVPQGTAEETMHAIGGTAPDFTVKLARKPGFDIGDPANIPPAGYLWTNAIAAGLNVANYGVMTRNGKALDPAIQPVTKPGADAFFEDLKQFEASGEMPHLILIQAKDRETTAQVRDALAKSRLKFNVEVTADLRTVETLLGLRPMTRKD